MPLDPESATAEPMLRVESLSKSFGNAVVLDSLTMSIGRGEVHALAGANGSGKSTFIKVLSGYHRPDGGATVMVEGRPLVFSSPSSSYALGLRFVHQDLGLINALSIEDNLSLNRGYPTRLGTIRPGASRRVAREMLATVALEIDPRTLVGNLSPATKTEVAVARALSGDDDARARVLVLDEPTATLPGNEVDRLLELVRRVTGIGVGVLYVTHRLGEIFRAADRVTVLRDGCQSFTGSVQNVTREEIIRFMVGKEFEETAVLANHAPTSGRTLMSVRGLVTDRVNGVDLELNEGEVLGVAGITGSGSETILGALFGVFDRRGEVVVGGIPLPPNDPKASIRNSVAYVPPDRKVSGGMMEASARENFSVVDVKRFWHKLHIDRRQERQEVQTWFNTFSVRPKGNVDLPLNAFSGGNQQKILLAKWLRCNPRVLLLDEPTQGVDIAAKAMIHRQIRMIADRGAGVIVSSSDVDEITALCDRVLVFRDGRIATILPRSSLSPGRISRESVGTVESTSLGNTQRVRSE